MMMMGAARMKSPTPYYDPVTSSFPSFILRRMRVRGRTTSGIGPATTKPKAARPRGASQPNAPAPRQATVTARDTFAATLGAAGLIRRSDGPEGTKALLSKHQIRRLDTWFGQAESTVQKQLGALLSGLASQVASALLLRCAAAQIADGVDIAALKSFAKAVGKLDDETLRERASVLDLDSTQNTNPMDPIALSHRRGVIDDPGVDDTAGDNDGLFQRFSASCGPTVVQMLACEADPRLAFAVHESGLHSDLGDDGPGRFQRALLEEAKGVPLARRDWQLRSRMRNATGRMLAAKTLGAGDVASFRRWIEGGYKKTKAATKVLAALRDNYDGFPAAAEVQRLLQTGPMPERDEGITTDKFLAALKKHVTPLTGVEYEATNPAYGFARGQVWRHLDRIATTVRRGVDVPFGISEPGHWMLITNVKGNKPHRSLLVSDPEGGRTAWVREADFKSGAFVDEQFHLCSAGERGFVDCVVFPKA